MGGGRWRTGWGGGGGLGLRRHLPGLLLMVFRSESRAEESALHGTNDVTSKQNRRFPPTLPGYSFISSTDLSPQCSKLQIVIVGVLLNVSKG